MAMDANLPTPEGTLPWLWLSYRSDIKQQRRHDVTRNRGTDTPFPGCPGGEGNPRTWSWDLTEG